MLLLFKIFKICSVMGTSLKFSYMRYDSKTANASAILTKFSDSISVKLILKNLITTKENRFTPFPFIAIIPYYIFVNMSRP